MNERICYFCGKFFTYEPRGRKTYCSEECYKKAVAARNSQHKKKKTKPETTTGSSITEIARAARAAGLSYGQYVDRMRQEGKC